MEVEILNSLLTSTVSLLFSPQLQSKNGEKKPELAGKSPSPAEGAKGAEDVSNWISANGKKWLEDAMSRLHVDYGKVSGKALVGKPVEELSAEKNRVKNELKKYDSNFMLLFRKQPGRVEKEPMRPLYVYYKKLKQALGRSGHGPQTQSTRAAAQHKVASVSMSTDSVTIKETAAKPTEKKPAQIAAGQGKVFDQWTFKDNDEVRTKIAELKGERGNLRVTLDKFQQDFVKAYNRKIKYNKDIAPVAGDFKRYKELKKIILKLEELLK